MSLYPVIQKHVRLLQNARPTPRLLVSPLEAATSKGGNHSWQLTRQPKQPRTTVYKLFRVQYLPTEPTNIRSIQSHMSDRYIYVHYIDHL